MHTLIKLKLGKHKGLIKSHLRTCNPIKIYRVMTNFSRKKIKGLSRLQGTLLKGIG